MTTSTTSYSGAEQRTSRLRRSPKLAVAALAAILVLSGCASTSINQNFEAARDLGRQQSGAVARWLTTDEARQQAQSDLDARLARPLGADDAVQIALAYSPSLQAMLYEAAADSAAATQSARLPNPVFAFERLVRNEGGTRDLEINRVLSFSVLDLLLLPAHLRMASYQQEMTRLSLAGSVVQAANEARGAWVNAVAAQQSLLYAQQIKATADASAELARRMQAVGNYSKLQRAREQAFAADAVAQLARAQHAERSARETLIRVLGLNDAQAAQLKLPDRLPELPKTPRDEASVARTALDQRLDVQLARSRLNFLAREQGLTRVTSVVNALEIGVSRNSATGAAPQKGYDVSLPLPIFDFGDVRRAGAQAAYMAAVNRTAQIAVQANSRVREQYSAYRTAYDLARHYRDEIVPLRKTIAEENVLRYNGMLIGVFELLADAREQITSVSQAIDAQRDFWLADAGLQAELLGTPGADMSRMTEAAPSRSGAAAH
ncbi:TolC family protein [Pelomonas aquatica]|jgi:outer membrane protein TolC|nr:TolC family protein [Pelomonas aquatica]MBY0365789.1 TolC family protein [Burkholderiaceae bacterium]MCY4754296.1 TolC family protein [Pelomonas aquatica]|mmetsp:Transcript_5442/g.20835  ORF Transcript_5442/g.20835 Transcript_5442/m.20835 type:complete len:492 (+) Transcript_5442:5295-6770(+)